MGDEYTIADIAILPWVRNLVGFYAAGELVGFSQFKNVARVLEAFVARPAVAVRTPRRARCPADTEGSNEEIRDQGGGRPAGGRGPGNRRRAAADRESQGGHGRIGRHPGPAADRGRRLHRAHGRLRGLSQRARRQALRGRPGNADAGRHDLFVEHLA
ncbi:hypothetical protein G6F57_020083 [Rhizopus arrhizus]|nr:hypothetical protein G6F57_020083 [Rhizopus arrhizus]